jgi:hypothetical protein
MKMVIHTGANNQFGGANEGFTRVGYHVETDERVKNEPTKPAAWHMIIEINNFTILK